MTAVDRMAQGYEPNFDIDYEVGQQGELYVARIIDSMKAGTIEVKTDEMSAKTGNVYLEVQCKYRGEWKASGIARTEADLWCHIVAEEVVIVAPVERVQAIARYYWRSRRYVRECLRGSHPTRGIAIPIRLFLAHLSDGVPEQPDLDEDEAS